MEEPDYVFKAFAPRGVCERLIRAIESSSRRLKQRAVEPGVPTSSLVSAITLAMIGMGYGFISGSSAAAVACYWPSSSYGRIASRLYIAWCVAAVSLPVLAGHLFDITGGYRTVVIIAGCGNLLGIAIALTLPRQGTSAERARFETAR